jgi:hypothetical protein
MDELDSTIPLVLDTTYTDPELQEPVSACGLLSSVQQSVKDVIVGLELMGLDEEASTVEERFEDFRELCYGFDDNREEPRRYRDELPEATHCLSAALEDALSKLPEDE